MKVSVAIEKGDRSLVAACSECAHRVTVWVRDSSDKAVRHACARLRDECPRGEENYYEPADGSDVGYENLVSSGKVPRGKEVPSMVGHLPKKPPPRKTDDD